MANSLRSADPSVVKILGASPEALSKPIAGEGARAPALPFLEPRRPRRGLLGQAGASSGVFDPKGIKRPVREEPALKFLSQTQTRLLDLFVQRVALEEGILLLLLNALSHRLLVTLGEIAGGGLPLFAGFGAFQCDSFLHGLNGL